MSTLFAATRRTRDLVGRSHEMQVIHDAVFPGDRTCRIVFIQGRGGFGKTRLLEETLWRLGNPSERTAEYPLTDDHRARGLDWKDFGQVIATDIVDLIDTRLHARNHFLRAVRESLRWAQADVPEANFNSYDTAIKEYERRLLDNVEYRLVQAAAARAEAAFWEDYTRLTKHRRIVWVIDTAEQLNVIASQWLIDTGLLVDEQLRFQAQKWLAAAVREKARLENTTLLLAGRDQEGAAFFRAIAEAAEAAPVAVQRIQAQPFDEQDLREYFRVIAAEWRQRSTRLDWSDESGALVPPDEAGRIAAAMTQLAEVPERLNTLHAYTGGQPVRLSLFADLVVEGRAIPEALKIRDASKLADDERELRQWELEEEVIALLFHQPWVDVGGLSADAAEERIKTASLRRDILLALVRARPGLTAEQLHFVIDNEANVGPEEWRRHHVDPRRVRQIARAMEEIQELSIVKSRPKRLAAADDNGYGATLRLGLQDEIYRLFAEHTAPHIQLGAPVNDAEQAERQRVNRLLDLIQRQDTHALERYQRSHADEVVARRRLYTLLRDWVDGERQALRGKLHAIREAEERDLEIEMSRITPAAPLSVRFRVTDAVERQRVRYRLALRELDLEHMHYAFLLDPDQELNEAYFDLAEERWHANDEDADILTQAEMWRILYDHYALRFVEWHPRRAAEERGEAILDVLRRAAAQEDATRWIKRLALRRDYDAAVQLADKLEAHIQAMPAGPEKGSWQHTFAQSERRCWREFARLLPAHGRAAEEAIENLRRLVDPLDQLVQHDIETMVFPEKRECGFIGHPAYIRLKRVLSVICANIAYGATQLGHFRLAVEHYDKALGYIRETGANAHRALVLNNLSRVMAEMGRQRALRLCRDALELRNSLGADVPIALSHSTLALIYNFQNNPDRAWIEAAKAVLLSRRVDDPRGRGLASLQLGDALRRLAAQSRDGRTLPATRDELYRAAEEALDDALGIFVKDAPSEVEKQQGKVQEPLRWIEIRIEKGCLYRDRVALVEREKDRSEWQRLYSTALGLLHEAAEEAARGGWERLQLDARINIAWTHYFADRLEEAEREIETCKELIGQITGGTADLIAEGRPLPQPREQEAYIYYQLSKLHGLRGRIAMTRFRRWSAANKTPGRRPDRRPAARLEAQRKLAEELRRDPHHLDQAADAYLLSVAYAQLYSVRSIALTKRYDALYGYLKKFNAVELGVFYRWVQQHHLSQRRLIGERVQPDDLGDVEEFLRESLGATTL